MRAQLVDLTPRSSSLPRVGVRAAPPRPAPATSPVTTPDFTALRTNGHQLHRGSRDAAAEREADRFAVMATIRPELADRMLARVRIHTDARSAGAAAALHAEAFTVGSDVYFGRGCFAPATARGAFLLRHELGHVAQNEPGTIRCFESFEHRAFGDRYLAALQDFLATPEGVAWARTMGMDAAQLLAAMRTDPGRPGQKIQLRPGVEITPGDAIALMGDFFGSTGALANANPAELRGQWGTRQDRDQRVASGHAAGSPGILDVIDREERAGRASAAENVDYETITNHRYSELALHNAPHFDPLNRSEWRRLHEQALELARAPSPPTGPGAGPDAGFQRAILIDAAAGHFLTDALAAGHLFDVAQVEAQIRIYLRSHPLAPPNPELLTVTAGLTASGLAEKLILKNVHDHLNTVGFQVSNAKGVTWQTFGDNSLRRSEQTQRIGALAIFLSRQQVVQARAGGTPDSDDVLALLPVQPATSRAVTEAAIRYIPEAANGVPALVNAQLGILSTRRPPWYFGGPVGPAIGGAVLDTITDPGRQRQLEDLQRRSEQRNAGPLLAPQATVLRF